MSRLLSSVLCTAVLWVLAGAALAQPADTSQNQFGDRQAGHFGDPGEGNFGNPAVGSFDNAAVRPPQPGQKPLGRVVSGKNEAPPYVVLQRPADEKVVTEPLLAKPRAGTGKPKKSSKKKSAP